jgi:DNA-binding SARP family transcriptional activator/predicted ATPase
VHEGSGLELCTFGGFALRRAGAPVAEPRSRSAKALLVLLACRRRPHPRAELATAFWPDRPDDLARTNLRSALYRIRACIGDALVLSRDSVAIDPGLAVDAAVFEAAVAVGDFEAAHGAYRGPFLTGFHYDGSPTIDNWISAEAARYHELAMTSCHALLDRALERGAADEVLRWARALLEIDPANEPAHRALMQGLSERGDRSAALRQFERAVGALRDDLGMEPEAETAALAAAIRSGRVHAVAAPAPSESPAPLDAQPIPTVRPGSALGAFFGRERELALLHELLTAAERHVVVVVGPGGIGKSRLAAEAAVRLRPHVQRCEIVDVSDARTADDLGSALARRLLPDPLPPGNPWQALAIGLARQETLVVVDSFEHLLEGAAQLAELVHAAPGVRVLVTSRVAIDHPAAVTVRLAGLEGHGPELFAHRARRRDPTFDAGAEAEAVRSICAAVDHVPLAIELAASWTGVLPCSAIVRALQRDAAAVLAVSGTAARERGMDGVFERSWSLLPEELRSALARLSVFPGSFSLEGAMQVAGASAAGIRALADASLVHPNGDGRLRLHEVVRVHARARLRDEEAEPARSAHLDVAIDRARWAFERNFGHSRDDQDSEVDLHADVIAALGWGYASPQHVGRYATLLELAGWTWRRYGRLGPELEWLERRPPDERIDKATAALLSYHRGHLLWMRRDLPEATAWLRRALEEGAAAGPSGRFATALAHSSLALCLMVGGDAAGAAPHASAAHRGFRGMDRPWFIALARGIEAWSLFGTSDLAEARSAIAECLALFRSLDNAWGTGLFLIRSSEIHLASGDAERAAREAREGIELLERAGFRGAVPEALERLAEAEAARSRLLPGEGRPAEGRGPAIDPSEGRAH